MKLKDQVLMLSLYERYYKAAVQEAKNRGEYDTGRTVKRATRILKSTPYVGISFSPLSLVCGEEFRLMILIQGNTAYS